MQCKIMQFLQVVPHAFGMCNKKCDFPQQAEWIEFKYIENYWYYNYYFFVFWIYDRDFVYMLEIISESQYFFLKATPDKYHN